MDVRKDGQVGCAEEWTLWMWGRTDGRLRYRAVAFSESLSYKRTLSLRTPRTLLCVLYCCTVKGTTRHPRAKAFVHDSLSMTFSAPRC